MYKITNNSNELYHYGVLGMRWGVRRYQNYDGTRIGAGTPPSINKSKMSTEASSGSRSFSVASGQNGQAKGNARYAAIANPKVIGKALKNARFAAAAGGNSSNKSEDKKSTAEIILEPSVKKGKDKANTSIAQETAKGLIRTGKATQDSIKVIKNSDPKVKKAQEDNATKARKMSDQELRESINRIKMEREYVSLKNDEITTGYDKAIGIIDKAKPFLEVAAEVAGLIASIILIKSKLGHSDSDTELDNLYAYCIENNFPSDVIEHATSLDLDYILDYYNVSDEDFQHMLTDEDELYHYGVLGMKWGVRRYQNYDGTRIGTGSGSGGGGGGSSASKSFRESVAGGQGGKAKGNARLAASMNRGTPRAERVKQLAKDVDDAHKEWGKSAADYRKRYTKYTEPFGEYDPKDVDKWLEAKNRAERETQVLEKAEKALKLDTRLRDEWGRLGYNDIDDDILRIGEEYSNLALWSHKTNWLTGEQIGDAYLDSANKYIRIEADPISGKRHAYKK